MISFQADRETSSIPAIPNVSSRVSRLPICKSVMRKKCSVARSRLPDRKARRKASEFESSPFARWRGTPRYSAWSVTAPKSSGRFARIG